MMVCKAYAACGAAGFHAGKRDVAVAVVQRAIAHGNGVQDESPLCIAARQEKNDSVFGSTLSRQS